jgi:hypothetical protein
MQPDILSGLQYPQAVDAKSYQMVVLTVCCIFVCA